MAQVEREVRRARVSPPDGPLVRVDRERCTECWGCVRHCPAHALKVVDGAIELVEARCVRCGACIAECPAEALSVRDDLPRVRALLSGQRPVVAVLASEHVAALSPLHPDDVEAALRALGFAGVETSVLGEELVASAYEEYLSGSGRARTRLRSTCPVAVDWVLRFHAALADDLVRLVPPYVAQARLVRELYPDDVAVVYVSPCWARKDEVFADDLLGEVDVAIGFDELERLLAEAPPHTRPERPGRRPQAVKQLSVTDGFPRSALSRRDLTDSDVAVVRGLADLERLLAAIERGEARPSVVDMLNCEGCIDGPCVRPKLSVFAKRNLEAAERERQPPPAVDSRTLLSALPDVALDRAFVPHAAPVREPTEAEIDAVLAAGEFLSRADALDCGACGYDTCVEHAAAILSEHSTWEVCFPLQRKRLARERERLATAARIDDLTTLANRRSFDERLAEEVSRAERYGTPLSVAMLDLDGFKGINDRHGHAAGDRVLRAVGALLRSELRATDVAARFGGDEFALVLPGVGKTDAWAVAEKVRASVRSLSVDLGEGLRVTLSASIGVATYGESHHETLSLLAAADEALYRAKRAGKDRVELAAG